MSEPILTEEQRGDLAHAAREAMANLSAVVPPIVAAMRQVTLAGVPALSAAMKPLVEEIKRLGLKPGDLERLALKELRIQAAQLERELAESEVPVIKALRRSFDTQTCYQCDPPREINPGNIERHLKVMHDGGKSKVPHPAVYCRPDEGVHGGPPGAHRCSCPEQEKL